MDLMVGYERDFFWNIEFSLVHIRHPPRHHGYRWKPSFYTMKSSYQDTLLILKNHGLPQSLPELSPFLLIPGMMCI